MSCSILIESLFPCLPQIIYQSVLCPKTMRVMPYTEKVNVPISTV